MQCTTTHELHVVTPGVSEQPQLFHSLHFKKSYGLYYQDVFSAQNSTTVGGKAPWRSLVLSWDYIQHQLRPWLHLAEL